MLTREQVKEYDDIGLIIIPSLFNVHEIEQMRWCFEALESMAADMQETGLRNGSQFVLGRKEGEQVIKRVVWAGGSQPYLLSVGADPRLTVPAAQLLGSTSIEQLLSQAHFKRPNDGVIFGWHQDIQHRDKGNGTWMDVNGRGSFVQTLIALDDNGNSSIILSLIFLDIALEISFLLAFKIDCSLTLRYWLNFFKTEFFLSTLNLERFCAANFAFSPIFSINEFLDILYLHQVIFMNDFFSTRIS